MTQGKFVSSLARSRWPQLCATAFGGHSFYAFLWEDEHPKLQHFIAEPELEPQFSQDPREDRNLAQVYITHTHIHTQTQYYMTGTFTRPSGRQGSCDKVLVRPFSQDTRCSKQVREKLQALDRVIAAHFPSLLRLQVKKRKNKIKRMVESQGKTVNSSKVFCVSFVCRGFSARGKCEVLGSCCSI